VWLKFSVPAPAPNATFAALSVPGATAGPPAPAPMFSVPVDPALTATVRGPPLVTVPPSATVSVPVPKFPMFTPELLLQVEPAPVTVTVPCEPARRPMLGAKGVLLMTLPPFAIMSVPVPKLPILSPPDVLLIHLELGPVTVTVPFEPADCPTEAPPVLFTVPPFWMVSVPVPRPPTNRALVVHVEPGSVTVTVPCEPGKLPTAPRPTRGIFTVPPLWIVSAPVPFWPTVRFCASARARDHCRVWRHGVNIGTRYGRRYAGSSPVTGGKPVGGCRSGPVGLGTILWTRKATPSPQWSSADTRAFAAPRLNEHFIPSDDGDEGSLSEV
jgi:hypothetical protein